MIDCANPARRARMTLAPCIAVVFALVPYCIATAELPTVETVIAAFRERKSETNYIRYRTEGEAMIPAKSIAGFDDETYMPTGKVYPPSDISFEWVSSAEFEVSSHRGVYEHQTYRFNVSDQESLPYHERLYFAPPIADVEYLLPLEPQKAGHPPTPPVRFVLNQERNGGGYASYYYGEGIESAFGYIANGDGEYYPIDDPDWLVTSNPKVTAGPSPDLINLIFTDESSPGSVLVYNLLCESNPPYRLMRIDREFSPGIIQKHGVSYRGDTLKIDSIVVQLMDFDTRQVSFNGRAVVTDFATSSSVPSFTARAQPEDGDWIRDRSTGRTYRYEEANKWSASTILLLALAVSGMLIAAYLFKRSFGSA